MNKLLAVAIGIVLIAMVYLFTHGTASAPDDRSATDQLKAKVQDEQPAKKTEVKAGSSDDAASQGKQQSNQSNNKQAMQLDIKTTKQGTGAQEVKAGDTVSVKYTGKLTDGTVFDSTDKHGGQPISFKIGVGQVIKGWDQGVVGMKVGEQRTLTIPGDLAYGPNGIPGVIPPNATLVFDIELMGINQ